jgi:hypothetical protein
MKKVAQNKCHFSNFPKRSQSKPSPKRRKFAQSGHPDSHICPGTCFYSVAILHRPLLSITFEQSTIDLRNVMLIFDDDYGDANLITVNFKKSIHVPNSRAETMIHLPKNFASKKQRSFLWSLPWRRLLQQNRRSWVRISPGCKVFGTLYIHITNLICIGTYVLCVFE